MIVRTEIAKILEHPPIGTEVTVMGWVRAWRSNRFIALNDGSTANTLQIVVDDTAFPEETIQKIGFHACVGVTGELVESQGAGQAGLGTGRVVRAWARDHRLYAVPRHAREDAGTGGQERLPSTAEDQAGHAG